ncbi:MAG: peptidoglycan DD-metalloendopeptidase family protein [Patescibacteria group bacterium]|nr:MAG: peptidoglycan DD-metalloendopeptidase family protein [Patescibacteria group bacterium]
MPSSLKKNLTLTRKTSLFALALVFFVSACHYGAGITKADESLEREIERINMDIRAGKNRLNSLTTEQAAYQAKLKEIQQNKNDLAGQLSLISTRLDQAKLEMEKTKINIDTTNLEIQKVNLEITEQDLKINNSRDKLAAALKILSQEGQKTQLEILLLNNYLTEYMNQVKYLENINDKITDNLNNLRFSKEQLESSQKELNAKKEELKKLQVQLQERQVLLAAESDTKNYLLDQTKSSEAEYQTLVAQAKREQQAAAADIANLERTMRQKIESRQKTSETPLTHSGFIWPVPSRVITAYFRDSTYPFRNIMEHSAIDIRAAQGTPVKAAGEGYIARARDAGMGYSYIMILHADGLATVYGHISRIQVKEDQYVSQGQVIGLSGGMPGTPGAGPMTTGPHLHFEVRKSGIPVDPLQYLSR